jgi:hypothetical protein
MKYLKTFERLGISDDLEQQVRKYMDKIEQEPTNNKFKFLYRNDKGHYYFDVVIKPDLSPERGSFNTKKNDFGATSIFIELKDRKDFSTLLHEVKHLDYWTRNGKKRSEYSIAGINLSESEDQELVSKKTLSRMSSLFYIYDDNEFQSKYHSYYNDFMEFMDDIVEHMEKSKSDHKLTTEDIRHLWKGFLQEHNDSTWSYYTTNRTFRFSEYFTEAELNTIFLYMISDYDDRVIYKNPYVDIAGYFIRKAKKNLKSTFNYFTKEQKSKIDPIVRHFEIDINKRIVKYRKRMTRIVTLACERYVK